MLPNLYEINFYDNAADRVTKERLITFHPSVVKYCRRFGQHIRTLSFHNMTFSSPSALSDILLSLSNIRSLSCSALKVKEDCPDQGLIPRRSLNRLHLTSLTIQDDVEKSLLNLLREAAICTATTLVCALDVESDDPAAVCEHSYALSSIQCDLWMHQLEALFPALAERRALKVVAVKYSALAGHNALMVSPIATSPDSRWAATGASDGTIIVWDLQSGCISQQWYAVENGPDSLAFSPNGQYLMSASRWAAARGKAATIWDLHQDARQMISLEAEAGPSLRSPQCINCIWAPDGSWIAAGAQEEGTVSTSIWETTTGAFQRRHETVWEGSELLAASADGRWIVAGVLDPRDRYFYHCWIRSVESGQVRRSLRGHTGQVNAAAFNSEGTRVVTGSADSTIRIWDAESGEQLLVMQDRGRDRGLDAVAFSADGRMVLSHAYGFQRGSDCGDGGVKVWDASNGALLASLVEARTEYYTTPHTACFSPCGRYIASASDGATDIIL
uniref:Transcriptional repressor TUP1 n=1 Tax=Ganoderma boninense TaxID=34458 RepID=A0A5K1JZP4_9APHY|nr:Transcriptional repressor TUP1 [Ganoderma boninense]